MSNAELQRIWSELARVTSTASRAEGLAVGVAETVKIRLDALEQRISVLEVCHRCRKPRQKATERPRAGETDFSDTSQPGEASAAQEATHGRE